MKKKKIITSLVLSCAILLGASGSASATASKASVTLKPTQRSVTSSTVGLSSHVRYAASNSSSSKHSVYAIVNKARPGKGWVTAGECLMAKGKTVSGTYSENTINWNLELNPAGLGCIGSSANGTIWY